MFRSVDVRWIQLFGRQFSEMRTPRFNLSSSSKNNGLKRYLFALLFHALWKEYQPQSRSGMVLRFICLLRCCCEFRAQTQIFFVLSGRQNHWYMLHFIVAQLGTSTLFLGLGVSTGRDVFG